MGDHRASIKIKMEFHGIKDECNMWINYCPQDCCNMDSRVIDFFNEVYKRGMKVYNIETEKYWAEQNKEKIEKEERTELERLKKKYKK